MKQILVLGAGLSATYLIEKLLAQSAANNWFITVAEKNLSLAEKAVARHPNGAAIPFDINNAELRATHIKKADIVVNMLPPVFQVMIAADCVHYGRHMISASYQSREMNDLNMDAVRKKVLILTEMGLDPGIDHMMAISLIEEVRERGGKIKAFKSYGGAIPAPDSLTNPLKYFITWNPRNIVMAGEHGAQYLEKGKVKLVPLHGVFQDSWGIDVKGLGVMEVYPNRESMSYRSLFDIQYADTIIRGTIRYPGWCETWSQIVKLGIPNENLTISVTEGMTYRDFVELFIPIEVSGSDLEQRVAYYLGINPTGTIMSNLKWLGLFSEKPLKSNCRTPAEVMIDLVKDKLVVNEGSRDMVVLINELYAFFEDTQKKEKITQTFIEKGDAEGHTAITRTVGLPLSIGVKLILSGDLTITGCHLPTHRAIYIPTLQALKKEGLVFQKKIETI